MVVMYSLTVGQQQSKPCHKLCVCPLLDPISNQKICVSLSMRAVSGMIHVECGQDGVNSRTAVGQWMSITSSCMVHSPFVPVPLLVGLSLLLQDSVLYKMDSALGPTALHGWTGVILGGSVVPNMRSLCIEQAPFLPVLPEMTLPPHSLESASLTLTLGLVSLMNAWVVRSILPVALLVL